MGESKVIPPALYEKLTRYIQLSDGDPEANPELMALSRQLVQEHEDEHNRAVTQGMDLSGMLDAVPQRDPQMDLDAVPRQRYSFNEPNPEHLAMVEQVNERGMQLRPESVLPDAVNLADGAMFGTFKPAIRAGAAALFPEDKELIDPAFDTMMGQANVPPWATGLVGGGLTGGAVAKALGGVGMAGVGRYAPYLMPSLEQAPVRLGSMLGGAALGLGGETAHQMADVGADRMLGSEEGYDERLSNAAPALALSTGLGIGLGGLGDLASGALAAMRSPSSEFGRAFRAAEATGSRTGPLMGLKPPPEVAQLYQEAPLGVRDVAQEPALAAARTATQALDEASTGAIRNIAQETDAYTRSPQGMAVNPPKATLKAIHEVHSSRSYDTGGDLPSHSNTGLREQFKSMVGTPVIDQASNLHNWEPRADLVIPLTEAKRLGYLEPGMTVKLHPMQSGLEMGGLDPMPRRSPVPVKVPYDPNIQLEAPDDHMVVAFTAKRMKYGQLATDLEKVDRLAKAGQKTSGAVDPLHERLQRAERDDFAQWQGNAHTARFPEAQVDGALETISVPEGSPAAMRHAHGEQLKKIDEALSHFGVQQGFDPLDANIQQQLANKLKASWAGANPTTEAALETLATRGQLQRSFAADDLTSHLAPEMVDPLAEQFAQQLHALRALNAYEFAKGMRPLPIGMGGHVAGIPLGVLSAGAHRVDPLLRGIDAAALPAMGAVVGSGAMDSPQVSGNPILRQLLGLPPIGAPQ